MEFCRPRRPATALWQHGRLTRTPLRTGTGFTGFLREALDSHPRDRDPAPAVPFGRILREECGDQMNSHRPCPTPAFALPTDHIGLPPHGAHTPPATFPG